MTRNGLIAPARETLMLLRFGIIGGLATLTHIAVAASLFNLGLLPLFAANVAAFMTAFVVAFTGHYFWTFQAQADLKRALWRYLSISLGAFLLNNVVLFSLVASGTLDKTVSIVVAAVIVPLISYIASRFWSFRK